MGGWVGGWVLGLLHQSCSLGRAPIEGGGGLKPEYACSLYGKLRATRCGIIILNLGLVPRLAGTAMTSGPLN